MQALAKGEGRSYKNYKSEGKATYFDILTVVSHPFKNIFKKMLSERRNHFPLPGGL